MTHAEPQRKVPGQCACCRCHMWHQGAPVHLLGGWRASYTLADGTIMDLSLCDDCLDEGEDLDAIWDVVVQGWLADEPTHRHQDVDRQVESGNFILARAYEMRWHEVEGPFIGVLR